MIDIRNFKVVVDPFLPTEHTLSACCIETKEEVSIPTGVMIHCIYMKEYGLVLLSLSHYEKLKQELNLKNYEK